MIGGLWLSIRCESIDGGFWSRRFLRIYSSVNQWSARWSYYADSTCSILLYTVTTAGTYAQRAIRRKRDGTNSLWRADARNSSSPNDASYTTFNDIRTHFKKAKGNVRSNVYRRILQNVNKEQPTTQSTPIDPITHSSIKDAALPSGTTELELHVIESRTISVDKMVSSSRCGGATKRPTGSMRNEANSIFPFWSRNCAPRTIRAPAILRFKARISLDWNGDYTLLLASRNDDLWEAPLRRCSETTLPNYFQAQKSLNNSPRGRLSTSPEHNRFNRRGRYWFSSAAASCRINYSFFAWILFLSCHSCFVHC